MKWRKIAVFEFHMGQTHRENRQPASCPGETALPDGHSFAVGAWHRIPGSVQMVRVFRQGWEDGANLDAPGTREPQLRVCLHQTGQWASLWYISSVIDVEGPSPLWVLQSLGCWAWAI